MLCSCWRFSSCFRCKTEECKTICSKLCSRSLLEWEWGEGWLCSSQCICLHSTFGTRSSDLFLLSWETVCPTPHHFAYQAYFLFSVALLLAIPASCALRSKLHACLWTINPVVCRTLLLVSCSSALLSCFSCLSVAAEGNCWICPSLLNGRDGQGQLIFP